MVAQAIVHQFCVSGDIDRSIATVNAALKERAATLAAALRTQVPGVRFTEPDGGYFLWVELPDDVEVDELVPAAEKRGVAVVKGSDFLLDGGRHSLRLAYSAVAVGEVEEGARRLAAAIADIRS
jgi:DNA-binding transcriptional MocR family regulator